MANTKSKSKRAAPEAAERTPILRQRFVEPPAVRKGNPHVAVRVPEELLRDLTRKAGGKDKLPDYVRGLLAKACGKKLADYLDESEEG